MKAKNHLKLFVLAVATCLLACGDEFEAPSSSKALEVTAAELTTAFAEDKRAAEAKYLGKTLEVSGKVAEVMKTGPKPEDQKLVLEGGFEDKGVTERVRVRVTLPPADLERVKPGEEVTLRARYMSSTPAFVILFKAELIR